LDRPFFGSQTLFWLLYPAAPLSGHYVSTEIAARNFTDKNRYNRLPQIAAAIGLEPTKRAPLWIDRALAVINETLFLGTGPIL